jgi:tetratricopeptide (TPR) repeat protein
MLPGECVVWRRLAVLAVLAPCVLGGRAHAASGDDAPADALLKRGIELRRAGNDDEALVQFRRAYDTTASARALAQIGLAEQALGRWVDAGRDLQQALGQTDDAWIVRNQRTLKAALATVQEHIGRLLVLGTPAGAGVAINGRRVGTLPLAGPIAVAAGDAVIALDAPGYITIARKVTVAGGALARETIDLPEEGPAVAPNNPASKTTDARVPAPPSLALAPPPESLAARSGSDAEPPPRRRSGRTAALVVGGVAGAALIAGAVADVYYVRKVNAFNAPDAQCGSDKTDRGPGPGCQGLYDSATRTKAIAIGGFVAGGILSAVAAGLLFYASPQPSPQGGGSSLACAWHGTGASCGLVF